jgi:hypothetical protein
MGSENYILGGQVFGGYVIKAKVDAETSVGQAKF